MTKSAIHLRLRKAQQRYHVCPTSGRPLALEIQHEGSFRRVFSAAVLWADSLWDDCERAASGPEVWTGSHHVTLEVTVVQGEESAVHLVTGELNCSAVVLLSRQLTRLERLVLDRKKRNAATDLWTLLPYDFYDLGRVFQTGLPPKKEGM